MVRIKMCGIRSFKDADLAVQYGADALGFVFADSRRYIDPLMAREIIRSLPPFVVKVGVFVDESFENICKTADFCGLDAVQLHGSEEPEFCEKLPYQVIKAFRVKAFDVLKEMERYKKVDAFLLDSYTPGKKGGTGKTFNWEIAASACRKYRNVILAGGLNAGNICEAIATVSPYGVDISSGIETGSSKDKGKIIHFMNEVRRVNFATT